MLKRTFVLQLTVILALGCSRLGFAQKSKDILGSWVRVGQGVDISAESTFQNINDAVYLKLEFENNRRMRIYGSYVARGTEVNYKFKKGKITYGFNRAFEVESYSDSTLVLIEIESGIKRSEFVKHYYLKEKTFLHRIAVNDGDWYINGVDILYFASKKLYPKFQTIEYPDFHLYVHNAAKESYNNGPNYVFASFSIEPSGLVKDIEIWNHINEEADARVTDAIQNSSNRWQMPLLNGEGVIIDMHIDDSYVKRDANQGSRIEMNQNEVFANNADAYRNGILLVARSFKLKDYDSALRYIELCEQIAPREPSLLYLRYKAYLAMNNKVEMSRALGILRQSRLNYLVQSVKN